MPVFTYHWDFFGPEARPTASHFLVHLEEFLEREGLEAEGTGLASAEEGHHAAWLRISETHEAALIRALRPQRKTA